MGEEQCVLLGEATILQWWWRALIGKALWKQSH